MLTVSPATSALDKFRTSVSKMLQSTLNVSESQVSAKVLTLKSCLSVTFCVRNTAKASHVLTFTCFCTFNPKRNTILLKKLLLKNGTLVTVIYVDSKDMAHLICRRILLAHLRTLIFMDVLLHDNSSDTQTTSVLKAMRRSRKSLKNILRSPFRTNLIPVAVNLAQSPLLCHTIIRLPYSSNLDVLSSLMIGFLSNIFVQRLKVIHRLSNV